MVTEDDSELVAQCLAGRTAAFEPLVARYQRPLFNLAYRMLGSHDQAIDATQNAFVKAYQHLDSFDSNKRFFSWIYRILKNECLNVLRDRRPGEPLPHDLAASGGPIEDLERRERRMAVQTALRALTDEHREVILLRHFTELSYEEIAAALDIPVKTVRARLYTARRRLATLLSSRKVS
jgi:RNA polymerase sigma-70 factor (ECF subfamily)